jgi:dihydrofolate synthase/folylpolyglutamate synthase
MTYEEAIEKIHSFQKFGSKLGLERMTRLMELLGNPQDRMKIIHVAGTNGKGSVCRYLYSVLQENGYRAGLYTSPYLQRFTERIEYNGSEISGEDLAACTEEVLEKVSQMLSEGMDSPTEFELITAIGFAYFARKEIDFLILEVGLGGTGDSTNIMKNPVASVITSISFDHMEYLGNTLEKIATQKAGIIKTNVPVIFNVSDSGAARAILDIAGEKGSKSYPVSSIQPENIVKTVDGYTFDVRIAEEDYRNLSISMIGMHQVGNAICALSVIEVLKNENIICVDKERIYAGMKKARQTGRLEVLRKDPYVIIDGAHNEAGVEALGAALKEHFTGKKILMVIGMLADKKIDKLVEKFSLITDDFIATEPDNPRKLSANELCRHVQKAGNHCIAIPNPENACQAVAERLSRYDVAVFAGSLYLIGKVRDLLKNEEE